LKELLEEIAEELGLNIDKEQDLISIAQYHVNEHQNEAAIRRKIIEEFSQDAEITKLHKIISRLPVNTIWTTNYDKQIEKSLKEAKKVVDVKHRVKHLLTNRPKADVTLYKMHGDVNNPADAILTKQHYERYYQTHQEFLAALSGDLITKTFLFLGFSFSDPNLDYVLSRLNYRFKKEKRQHYCILKRHKVGDRLNENKDELDYNKRKQELRINDLKRYGIKALLVDEYEEIDEILSEIENRYKKKTIFISGSATTYEPFEEKEAKKLIHLISKKLINNNYKIVNGFGIGVGSAVINGALDMIYKNPNEYSKNQLILKPFPQFQSSSKGLEKSWEDYRQDILSLAGIAIFLFGNKKNDKDRIISANGVLREFEIASDKGIIPIPIFPTKYAGSKIFKKIKNNPKNYYRQPNVIMPMLKKLHQNNNIEAISEQLIKIIKQLNS
jgi:hypothetical protein